MVKHVCVCMVCMSAICIGNQMDSPIGLPKLASLSTHGFTLKFWVAIIGRCEGQDDMGGYLHPHIESGTLRVYVYVHDGYKLINKEIDPHITKNLTSLSAFGSILKNFLGNRCRWMRESYSWSRMTQWVNIYIPI